MLKETKEGVIIPVKVIPRAKNNDVIGWENNRLRVRVAAVPDKGKANAELEKHLAKVLGVAKSNVQVVKGLTSRQKELLVRGVSAIELTSLLPDL